MNKRKFLTILLLSFPLVTLTNGSVFAEHQCTHQVVHSDGTTTISTDCSSSKTDVPGRDPGMYQLPYYLKTQEQDLLDSANGGDEAMGAATAKDNPQQVTDESQDKDQKTMEEQQIKQQEQEDQLENYKQRHSM